VRVTVFGSTGHVGRLIVALAVAEGHDVTAFARDPARLAAIRSERLCVVVGELADSSAVDRAVEGADVVVSALGPGARVRRGELADGMRTVLDAMATHGVRRLVALSTASVQDSADRPDLAYALLVFAVRILFHGAYAEVRGVADVVRESRADWTLVRVGLLWGGSDSGVRAGRYGRGEVGLRVSRAGLARVMLDLATSGEHLHEALAVSDARPRKRGRGL
jgi:putative NADH-flavin reductase